MPQAKHLPKSEASLILRKKDFSGENLASVHETLRKGVEALADCFRLYTFHDLAAGVTESTLGVAAPLDESPDWQIVRLVAQEWPEAVICRFDRQMIYDLTSVFFGGSAGVTSPVQGLEYSPVERRVEQVFVEALSSSLSEVFKLSSSGKFRPLANDHANEFFVEGRPAVLSRVELRFAGMSAEFFLTLPESGLRLFLQDAYHAPKLQASDPEQRKGSGLQSTVIAAALSTRAVILGPKVTLELLNTLEVGQFVEFGELETLQVRLECSGQQIFDCKLGKTRGYYSVCIEQPTSNDKRSQMIDLEGLEISELD